MTGCKPTESEIDAELERIMSLTDAELRAEYIAEGLDPEKAAAEARAIFERVQAIYKRVCSSGSSHE